jgi:ribonucleotide reductase beta subunit family protein with ferritin-like domain
VSEEYTRVSLCFQEEVFTKVYQELFDCVVDIHREDLVRMARGQ